MTHAPKSRVRETYVVIDGTELVAVEWLSAEGAVCGHLEVPVAEWSLFIEQAARPYAPLLDRAPCGGCGHAPHLDDMCCAAIFAPGARTTDEFCRCGNVDIDPGPVEPHWTDRLRLVPDLDDQVRADRAYDCRMDEMADEAAEATR